MRHRKYKAARRLQYQLEHAYKVIEAKSDRLNEQFITLCGIQARLKRVEHRADNAEIALHNAMYGPLEDVRKDSVKLAALRFALAACEGVLPDRVRAAWEATK